MARTGGDRFSQSPSDAASRPTPTGMGGAKHIRRGNHQTRTIGAENTQSKRRIIRHLAVCIQQVAIISSLHNTHAMHLSGHGAWTSQTNGRQPRPPLIILTLIAIGGGAERRPHAARQIPT